MLFKLKNSVKSKLVILLVFISLTSCAQKEANNRLLGAAVGAALGGFVGAQFGAGTGKLMMTALGAGAGSFLGSEIAARLTEEDRISLKESIDNSAKYGELNETYQWNNKSKKVKALIKPVSEVKAKKGSCKNLEVEIFHNDKSELNNTEVCYKNT
tara:strand:- start:206 stop:673 length:468 start_codon:yes stop_codon:yes gene_type:complete